MPRKKSNDARASRFEINPLVAVAVVVALVAAIAIYYVRSGNNEITLPKDPRAWDALAPTDEMLARMKEANPNLKLPPEMAAAVERRRERERQGQATPSLHSPTTAAPPQAGPPGGAAPR